MFAAEPEVSLLLNFRSPKIHLYIQYTTVALHSDLSPKKPGDPASCTVSYLESPYKIHGAGSPYKKHDPYKLCGVCTFLTEVPHKMHGGHTKCIVATQNTRHFLLESFVWEEAIHVPFLNRGVSYD